MNIYVIHHITNPFLFVSMHDLLILNLFFHLSLSYALFILLFIFFFFVVLTFSYNLQNYNYTLLFASFCVFMICFVFSIKFSFICARIFNIVKLIIFVCVKFQHVLNLHISAKYKKNV